MAAFGGAAVCPAATVGMPIASTSSRLRRNAKDDLIWTSLKFDRRRLPYRTGRTQERDALGRRVRHACAWRRELAEGHSGEGRCPPPIRLSFSVAARSTSPPTRPGCDDTT